MTHRAPQRMSPPTPAIGDDRRAKLQALLPEVFTAGGQLDVDRLRQMLGDSPSDTDERFGLYWPGKQQCHDLIREPSTATLQPVHVESKDWNTTQHVFIEGDNLAVLKLLQRAYHSQIGVIYIDPPYNTGQEFVYSDRYQQSTADYLSATAQDSATGTELDGRYHSRWLSMLYPRLLLARNLLKDSGVIFISIDDHELHHLVSIGNEIFGEENFIDIFSWVKSETPANLSTKTKKAVEYVVCYQKLKDKTKFVGLKKESKSSNGLMNKTNAVKQLVFPKNVVDTGLPDGVYRQGTYGTKAYTIVLHADTRVENGIFVEEVILSGNFKWTQPKLLAEIEQGTTVSIRTASFSPSYDRPDYAPEVPWNLINRSFGVDTNETAGKQLADLFDGQKLFDYPKPVSLVQYLLGFCAQEGDIVLDFFAGSCTTAESVMRWSQAHGKALHYIMVQLAEPTPPKSAAYRAGYTDLAALGRERIRRAAQRIAAEIPETTPALPTVDLGLRAFKLAPSNFGQDAADQSPPTGNDESVLYELLLEAGFALTVPVISLPLVGESVYSVAGGTLLICLARQVDEALLQAIAKQQPKQVICLAAGFEKNDELLARAATYLEAQGVQQVKIV